MAPKPRNPTTCLLASFFIQAPASWMSCRGVAERERPPAPLVVADRDDNARQNVDHTDVRAAAASI
ncbi:hypothetical protein [Actinomadura rubrobrunea]|uniref:hypothetical protein n=1 Tax=Actinomadura rubrobrunea TaxID=115335 RepID=UPI0014721D6B|nr:hypothetical protein [Actinomadura rubrobrunea]